MTLATRKLQEIAPKRLEAVLLRGEVAPGLWAFAPETSAFGVFLGGFSDGWACQGLTRAYKGAQVGFKRASEGDSMRV